MHSYITGKVTPRTQQYIKLQRAIHSIARELQSVSIQNPLEDHLESKPTPIPAQQANSDVRTLFAELQDIVTLLKWVHISRDYFGNSSTWIYQKLQGRDEQGNADGFTPEEQQQMKAALLDMADRLRRAADRI